MFGTALLALTLSAASAEPAAIDRVAAIAVRVLGYDRGLSARSGDAVEFIVVAAADAVEATRVGFAALDGVRVQGLPLRVTTLVANDDLAAGLRAKHPAAVFVDGDADVVKAVAAVGLERAPLVFVRDRALLGSGGQVAITVVDGRPRLVVSLPALRAAHIELSSDVLKLADVIR